jgi:uncharacterized membrane protein YeaQ/YmgE (transglycosylase-associated protein family)
LAGVIVTGYGFGPVGNIVVGIVGAFIAAWLLPRLGLYPSGDVLVQIMAATVGAVVLLVVWASSAEFENAPCLGSFRRQGPACLAGLRRWLSRPDLSSSTVLNAWRRSAVERRLISRAACNGEQVGSVHPNCPA